MTNSNALTILVTGATNGIGYETARELAKRGHILIITGRNEVKGNEAVSRIIDQTGNANIDFWKGDLSLLSVASELVRYLKQKYGKLDVLINNAGGGEEPDLYTAEKVNYCYALNCLVPFFLSQQLFPLLEASQDGRLINLNSRSHYLASFDEQDAQGEFLLFSSVMAYPYAKLCQLLWTFHLARQKNDSRVAILVADPGTTDSPGFLKAHDQFSGGISGWVLGLHPIFTSTAQAGRVAVTAALNPEFAGKKKTYITLAGGIHKAKEEAYHFGHGLQVFDYCTKLCQSILNPVSET